MSGYVNTGVYWVDTAERVRTKKALREEITANGDDAVILFDTTSGLGPFAGELIAPVEITGAMRVQVTGPDPYTARKWYATVERAAAGKHAGKLVVT